MAKGKTDKTRNALSSYRRILRIDELISSGVYPSINDMIEDREIEASRPTIFRTLEFMKNQLHAPIEFDRTKDGYYYSSKTYRLPSIWTSEQEMLTVATLKNLISSLEGTPLYDSAKQLLEKVENSAVVNPMKTFNDRKKDSKDKVDLSPIENRIELFSVTHGEIPADVWNSIDTAMKENKVIEFYYERKYDNKKEKRRVKPYQIFKPNDEWCLWATDIDKDDFRIFTMSRISEVKITFEKFTLPKDFEPRKHFKEIKLKKFNDESYESLKIKFKTKPGSEIYFDEIFISWGYEFDYDKDSGKGTLILPKGEKCFKIALFADKNYILSVELPNGLEELFGSSFINCTSLKEIYIPESIEKISGNAFHNCTSLEKVVSKSNCILDENFFAGCTKLKEIEIDSLTSVLSFGGKETLGLLNDCRVFRHFTRELDIYYKGKVAKKGLLNMLNEGGIKCNVKEFSKKTFAKDSSLTFIFIVEEELNEDFKTIIEGFGDGELVVFVLHDSPNEYAIENAKKLFSKEDESSFKENIVIFQNETEVYKGEFTTWGKTDQIAFLLGIVFAYGFGKEVNNLFKSHISLFDLYDKHSTNGWGTSKIKVNPETDYVIIEHHLSSENACFSDVGIKKIQSRCKEYTINVFDVPYRKDVTDVINVFFVRKL